MFQQFGPSESLHADHQYRVEVVGCHPHDLLLPFSLLQQFKFIVDINELETSTSLHLISRMVLNFSYFKTLGWVDPATIGSLWGLQTESLTSTHYLMSVASIGIADFAITFAGCNQPRGM